MRWILGSLLIVLSLAAPSRAGEWVTFTCKEGHFSVRVPTTPVASEKVYPSFMGKVKTHIFIANADNSVFTLSYTDVPSIAVGFARGKTFSRARDMLLLNCGGKEISFTALKHGKQRSKELIYQIAPQGGQPLLNGRTWFILLGRQLIVADALVRVGPAEDRLAQEFLSSLKTESDD